MGHVPRLHTSCSAMRFSIHAAPMELLRQIAIVHNAVESGHLH